MNKNNLLISVGIVAILVLSRVLPHFPNFTPIVASGIFLTYFLGRKFGFLITLFAFIISDLCINLLLHKNDYLFTPDIIFSSIALLFITVFSSKILTKLNVKNLLITTVVSSLIFYLVSNFGAFLSMNMYAKNVMGLLQCYIAGIPFISLPSDLFYSFALYFLYSFVNKYYFAKKQVVE